MGYTDYYIVEKLFRKMKGTGIHTSRDIGELNFNDRTWKRIDGEVYQIKRRKADGNRRVISVRYSGHLIVDPFPIEWETDETFSGPYHRVNLDPSEDEYKTVETLIHQTYQGVITVIYCLRGCLLSRFFANFRKLNVLKIVRYGNNIMQTKFRCISELNGTRNGSFFTELLEQTLIRFAHVGLIVVIMEKVVIIR